MLQIGMSGSHSHEAFMPAGPHGPVRIILVPSPNFPAARLTHSGENIQCVHSYIIICLTADLVPERLENANRLLKIR